ncbi:hypothetical protein PPERSA_00122 [Pseudocohnilembus persalinus]|uniref:Transmembrane protein n=1 Tax=Pseudocohnilembus persalinus TaxID=266149 RepID=A0A0V0Q8G5_PSEPJ|nr:hypothetical protein PPERSA_00122 [Pseudocohnilembus persalinus]|eukprot:KRW98525.1 hypothetical protein PPERSA_00122 [Pseudocohnilembus persalinus]
MQDIESNSEYKELKEGNKYEMVSEPDDEIKYDPLAQYNLVIKCYNLEFNRVDNNILQELQENKFLTYIVQLISKPLGTIICLLILILPFINIAFGISLLIGFLIYNQQHKISIKNSKKVMDPFQNMIFSPEMCELVDKNFHYFEQTLQCKIIFIEINYTIYLKYFLKIQIEIEGLSINMDVFAQLKERDILKKKTPSKIDEQILENPKMYESSPVQNISKRNQSQKPQSEKKQIRFSLNIETDQKIETNKSQDVSPNLQKQNLCLINKLNETYNNQQDEHKNLIQLKKQFRKKQPDRFYSFNSNKDVEIQDLYYQQHQNTDNMLNSLQRNEQNFQKNQQLNIQRKYFQSNKQDLSNDQYDIKVKKKNQLLRYNRSIEPQLCSNKNNNYSDKQQENQNSQRNSKINESLDSIQKEYEYQQQLLKNNSQNFPNVFGVNKLMDLMSLYKQKHQKDLQKQKDTLKQIIQEQILQIQHLFYRQVFTKQKEDINFFPLNELKEKQ